MSALYMWSLPRERLRNARCTFGHCFLWALKCKTNSFLFPKQCVALRGSSGKCKGRVLIEVLALTRWFRLRRNAVLRFYVDFDCAGSHKACVAEIAISKTSLAFVRVFGNALLLQAQGIGRAVKIEAGAVFCGHCQNVGRCASFEELCFTWQAQ